MAETTKRRTDRVLINLPVSITGTTADGKPFSEDTFTTTVSENGAAIAVKTPLVPGQEIVIRRQRPRNPRVAKCRVAGLSGKQGGLQVFSIGFREPTKGFWDIYFPQLPSAEDVAGRALLECGVCKSRKVVHLDPRGLAGYNADRQLSLDCAKCGKSTTWVASHQEAQKAPGDRPANSARLANLPSSVANNQRKHNRVAAEIPVCIRQAGSEDTVGTTVDISHGGLRFTSSRHYLTGSYIQVAVPYSPAALNVFVDARIVHGFKEPSQELYHYGIKYVAENE